MTNYEEIMHTLGRIEAKQDAISDEVKQLRDVSVKRFDDHAKRVASLEKSRSWQKGRDAVLGVLVSGTVMWWLRDFIGLGR